MLHKKANPNSETCMKNIEKYIKLIENRRYVMFDQI